jgi:hypothetical protein
MVKRFSEVPTMNEQAVLPFYARAEPDDEYDIHKPEPLDPYLIDKDEYEIQQEDEEEDEDQ